MRWTTVKADVRYCDFSVVAQNLSVASIIQIVSYAIAGPPIVIQTETQTGIKQHLSMYKVEAGGLLIGKVHSLSSLERDLIAIEITSFVPSNDFDGSAVALRMNSSVWSQTSQVIGADELVVGWYHSHPNLGAFFSGTDRVTQRRFFSNAYSIGLVIDPIRNEEKWFLTGDSIEVVPEKILRSLPWAGVGKSV